MTLKYIQLGKPVQNAFIERFNRIFREDVLDAYWFEDLEQLRIIIEKWRYDYNYHHSHSTLKGQSPVDYLAEAVNSGKVLARAPTRDFTIINSSSNSTDIKSNKKD